MTKPPNNRRSVLMAAAVASVVVASGTTVHAQDMHGVITFNGGVAIPEGDINLYLEDLSIQNTAQRRLTETRVTSDGGSKNIAFSIPAPEMASPTLQIVARLTRSDGWLIARGSAQINTGTPISVTLNEAVY